jgi:hypothetical protein
MFTMRFMTLIKSAENGKFGPPPPELFQAIAMIGTEAAKAGVLVETAGLLPTSAGARVRLTGGRIAEIEGPFDSGHEMVGGYAIFNVGSRQEAIDWVKRFMDAHREHWKGWEGETEIRQLMPTPGPESGGARG